MQIERRYSLFTTLNWTKKYIFLFLLYDSTVVLCYYFFNFEWLSIPWQPLSLIGIAVAFYLGFKNNSSYERVWEGRKIWGGIVNTSRSFTVMIRDFINNDEAQEKLEDKELLKIKKRIIHRHVAWLKALTFEMRKVKSWEHQSAHEQAFRKEHNTDFKESRFEELKDYISEEDYQYAMSKGNRSSHLLSIQSKDLMALRSSGHLEHFRHLEIQSQITELYTLQGKSERIKNFPFPRQYASINYYFVVLFIALLPLGMLDVFNNLTGEYWIWMTIPFAVIGSWVFWLMELIGDHSENPFEGLYNDVPISSMARGIEIDIRQMIDEENLPESMKADDTWKIIM